MDPVMSLSRTANSQRPTSYIAAVMAWLPALLVAADGPSITLEIKDFVTLPINTNYSGLSVRGYETTAPVATPGPIQREGVLIEWADTNRSNTTFEGAVRDLLRVPLNTRIHPLGALSFNPAARRGDDDWR